MNVWALFKRDFLSFFKTPLGWIVLTLFLVVEGYSFYLFAGIISQSPLSTADSISQLFFGGTLVYWFFIIALISLLTMRSLAAEREHKTLDLLFVAPFSSEKVLIAKFFSIWAFYIFLWLPTFGYFLYVFYLCDGFDFGPLFSGYLGSFLVGGSFIAIGIFASALSAHAFMAALMSFVILAFWLLTGLIPFFTATEYSDLIGFIDVYQQMTVFNTGVIDVRYIIFHLSIIFLLLNLSYLALNFERGFWSLKKKGIMSVLGIVSLALFLFFMNLIAHRHPLRIDMTFRGIHALDPSSKKLLRQIKKDSEIIYIASKSDENVKNRSRIEELLKRIANQNKRIRYRFIDIDQDPAQVKIEQSRFGIEGEQLKEGMVIVFSQGRYRLIASRILFSFNHDKERIFNGEKLILSSIVAISLEEAPKICFMHTHGEIDPFSYEDLGYGQLVDQMRRRGFDIKRIDALELKQMVNCKTLVIAGPTKSYAFDDLRMLETFMQKKGRIFLLLGPTLNRQLSDYRDSGFENLLASRGISLEKNIVIDSQGKLGTQGLFTFKVKGLSKKTPFGKSLSSITTIWPLAREIKFNQRKHRNIRYYSVVESSAQSWVRSDLKRLQETKGLFFDATRDELKRRSVAVAVENCREDRCRPELVIWGSERGVLNRRIGQSINESGELFIASVAWLSEETQLLTSINLKRERGFFLYLSGNDLRLIFLLFVVSVPSIMALLGLVIWRKRRRR